MRGRMVDGFCYMAPLYGSAARGTIKYDSDVDLLLDFPDDALTDAWDFAETACWDRELEPDLLPVGWCKGGVPGAYRAGCAGAGVSDARWFEIESAVAASVKHFAGAASIFRRLSAAQAPDEQYMVEMAFMHAMQAGQTSMETALLRILDLCDEETPTGARWNADLIARVGRAVGNRPVILDDLARRAASMTRRFRSMTAHAYDAFDQAQAADAVQSATLVVSLLPAAVAGFRKAFDP